MRQIDTIELKCLQVDILKEIDSFCHTNNIKYSIAYGTLIGAVRHRGYIPWDDDIDVIMMRDDYERFLKTFNMQDNDFYVISTDNCSTYYAPYANVYMKNTKLEEDQEHGADIGIKVDVFPVDHLPDRSILRKMFFMISLCLGYIIGFKNEKSTKGKSLAHLVCAKISRIIFYKTNVNKVLSRFARWSNKRYNTSATINNIVWCAAGEKGSFSVTDFDDVVKMDFENYQFDALKGYDNFLKNHYGDYMKLPPEEKRVTKHSFKAWVND